MKSNIHCLLVTAACAAVLSACGATTQPPSTSLIGTTVAEAAFGLMTETAAAASPTPRPPTATPPPSSTPTPALTTTPTGAPKRPQTSTFTGCWFGPGPSYTLESNITKGKAVDILGVGSQPGWYIIRNPYFHKPCWIQASALTIFPGTDLSALPVMTPGP